MKKLLPLIGLLLFLSPLRAVGPTATTMSAEYPYQGQFAITYVSGSITSFMVTTSYRKDITVIAGGALVSQVQSSPSLVGVDLVANAGNTVCTVASVPYTGAQVQAILLAMALQARTAQGGPF